MASAQGATAGFLNTDWNPRDVPAGTLTRNVVLRTADSAATGGTLYVAGPTDTVVCIMHPREFMACHYLIPDIVGAGVAAWSQSPRSVGNDMRLEHEIALHDVAAGLTFLRDAGFRRIILCGNSGGSGLFALYAQQSAVPPAERIARTPGGRPTGLATLDMPPVDGMILLAPHPGQGALLMGCIDPSVADEADALSVDPSLDPFSPTNGYGQHPAPSRYEAGFVARYRAAQHARVERLDRIARALIGDRMAARKALKAGDAGPDIQRRAAHTPIMNVWRTDADLRCFDLTLDPSDRKYGSLWGRDPFASNYGAVGFARTCTPESWLSTWSGVSSNALLSKTAAAIVQPTLLIEYTGDQCCFPSVIATIAAGLGSSDVRHERVRGDHHGRALTQDEEAGRYVAGRMVADWLHASFRPEWEDKMRHVRNPIAGVTYAPDDEADRYIAAGAWTAMSVGEALRRTARAAPERQAFIGDERSVTFRELDEETDRLGAALLGLGLAPGDRAMCQLGTTIETVVALVACYKAGIVPVCAVPQYREIEIGQLARMSACRAYIVQSDLGGFDLVAFARRMMAAHPHIAHLLTIRGGDADTDTAALIRAQSLEAARRRLADIEIGPGDVLSFQLSGGTTGVPKIIPRFHGEYLGHSAGWMRCFGIEGDCRLVWSLPLIHNAGQLYALMPVLLMGISVVLLPRVDIRRMLDLIETHRVTHALSIGPVAPQLIAYTDLPRHDLSSLRHFATMSRAGSLEAHLGVPCSNLFGITEGLLLGAPASASATMRHDTQGYSGEPLDEISLRDQAGAAVAVGEVGELCFRGPSSLRGYYDAPEATRDGLTPDGFVRTGDMMRAHLVDGQICYAFEGRLRDNVNRGGEKIGCEEVEALVSRHPAVADAKLVPMPDPIYGERGCIYLIVRPGHAAPDIPDLIAFLTGAGLAKFKCPERIETVAEFPVTRVGKLDKVALRRMIAETMAAEDAQRAVPA